ncbi:MAG: tRNA (uridine(34)/cytosine(34)/5-carboxymethylaminomethyluridine(34)-2'-O)-methyltransferase TrmL [Methylophilaceae bacterium]
MLHIVLFEPEIPPNTGNIIRLCANTGAQLHLVEPMGFRLQDKQLIRAGLDYHEFASMQVHEDWAHCKQALAGKRMFALTTKGSRHYHLEKFADEDVFVFGPETRGLPLEVQEEFAAEHRLRLPMLPESRSLNLSNSVAVVLYEAWRQLGFDGGM